MRKSWLRIGLGVASAAGIAGASFGGTMHASANTVINGYNLNGDGGCHNLNAEAEANTSALTAIAANDRGYAQIANVTVTASAKVAPNGGSAEAGITVNLCGAIPSFPVTSNGDTGASWYVCFAPNASEPIASNSTGVITNPAAPPLGNPIHEGPFPATQGFRACAWLSENAGTGVDYGVALSDPIDQFTFLDPANLWTGVPTAHTIDAPVFNSPSSFTIYFPYTWVFTDSPGSPLQAQENETWVKATDVTTDWNAEAWVNAEVNLPSPPAPICVPTTCLQGIVGLLVPVDFVPGYQLCSTPVIACQNFNDASEGRGMDLGLEMDFPVGSIQTPVNPVNPATDCPGVAGPLTTVGLATGFGTAGAPWVYAPIYGRILPGPVNVNGQQLHPFGVQEFSTADFVTETL